MTNALPSKSRVQSIDVLRGIIMIIMALDHVRDFFHKPAGTSSPLNLATTTPELFFTRWITHFCAPVFVFLAGTSIFLMAQRKSKAELSIFLFKRGLWLIILEVVVLSFGFTFNPSYPFILFEVIWAIGISMVILSLLVRLPYKVLLVLGLIIVFGHDLLDYAEANRMGGINFWWGLAHFDTYIPQKLFGDHFLMVIYPFAPWTGTMILGYCLGKMFTSNVDAAIRRKFLLQLGTCLILLFVIVRFINGYGDPSHWKKQSTGLFTFLSFLNVSKYPPSMLYLCITLGPAMILLALIEKIKNWFTSVANIFGRVPLFYFVVHFYIIHVACLICFFASGYTMKDAFPPNSLTGFRPADFGYSLLTVYGIWLLLLIIMYPLCKKYNHYKSTHSYWWLSYL